MPAGEQRGRTLDERVQWAANHADPDVRALAEAVLLLLLLARGSGVTVTEGDGERL